MTRNKNIKKPRGVSKKVFNKSRHYHMTPFGVVDYIETERILKPARKDVDNAISEWKQERQQEQA